MGILKETRPEEDSTDGQPEKTGRLARPRLTRKRVSFGQEVKGFDGERKEQCIEVIVPTLA